MISDDETFKAIAKSGEPISYETYDDLLYKYIELKFHHKTLVDDIENLINPKDGQPTYAAFKRLIDDFENMKGFNNEQR